MTNILALETSSDALSVALSCNGEESQFHEVLPKKHSERLLPVVKDLLSKKKMLPKDLDAIAVSRGPGSFTGIRLACSFSQGLMYSSNIKGIGVNSLEVLSKNIHTRFNPKKIVVLIDAQMGNLYKGVFNYEQNILVSSSRTIISAEKVNLMEYNKETFFVGSGCKLIRQEIEDLSENIFDEFPNARDLLSISIQKYLDGIFLKPEELLPVYLTDETYWKTS